MSIGHPPRENDAAETYHRRRGALFAAALALVLVAARHRPFRVEVRGGSMRPTLEQGDWCVAVRNGRVHPGHVVVIRRPDRPDLEVVKRVVRAEGGGWFVVGDDPLASTDSREFGPVPESAILGRIRLVYWPPRRFRVV